MNSLRSLLPSILDRLQPSETTVMLGTAVVVGAGTGRGASNSGGVFAVVGRAAVFAGASRAPFTAILIVAERLQRDSIYTR